MKKRLTLALAAGALVAAMLPGVAAAGQPLPTPCSVPPAGGGAAIIVVPRVAADALYALGADCAVGPG